MRIRTVGNLTIIIIAPIALFCGRLVAADEPYKFLKEISVGGEGGWDILTIDNAARRLYLAHTTQIEVVDIDADKVVGEIKDTPGVHAFLAVPELRRGFSSNGRENKASVVDLKSLQTVAKIDTGESPDAIAYDVKHREVYVFNHRGKSVTVIDASSQKVSTTISLDGSPEFPVWDEAAGRIYCNIEDKSEVAAIDTEKHTVVANWPLAPGEGPTGIALDATHHRLFCACHGQLVMLDTATGRQTGVCPTGKGADGCAFDPATGFIFVPCGEGLMTIAKVDPENHPAVVQTLQTRRGGRTIALDPKTHRIFLPTADYQPAPSPAPDQTPSRPGIVPNTLKLLVYGPAEKS